MMLFHKNNLENGGDLLYNYNCSYYKKTNKYYDN